jgi:dihydroorotate dehydrogenase electron transfer subunit
MSVALPEPSFVSHRPRAVTILAVTDEASDIKSLIFRDKLTAAALPGQFGMVWAPGVDEVPMSLLPSGRDDAVTIAVKKRGKGTAALLGKGVRSLIGVRGPYGRGFTSAGVRKVLMVAGGMGVVPLLALLRSLASAGVQCSFIHGAHTSQELLFRSEIGLLSESTGGTVRIVTDDGSAGAKGLATDETAKVLHPRSFDCIYTCGPEIMMRRVVDLASEARIPAEASLERIFKCGSGICGSCCIGPYLTCRDGPVFTGETLRGLLEFGRSTRDASGSRVTIDTS